MLWDLPLDHGLAVRHPGSARREHLSLAFTSHISNESHRRTSKMSMTRYRPFRGERPPVHVNIGMQVLLVGEGASAHSVAYRLLRCRSVRFVFVVPGNYGVGEMDGVCPIKSVASNDFPGLVQLAKTLDVDLVVAGCRTAIIGGIKDHFIGSTSSPIPSLDIDTGW
jgi:hypothetical protein